MPNYRCNRKFCNACLMRFYEDDFNMCKNNRSWICQFCYGVCSCTRCLRQDNITQLKAYYISMGGTLASLQPGARGTEIPSQLDKVVFDNFQTHLWLTLLSNVHLIARFPSYMKCVTLEGLGQEQPEIEAAEHSLDSESEVQHPNKKTVKVSWIKVLYWLKFDNLLILSVERLSRDIRTWEQKS